MRPELLDLAADLARRGEPFALATVVRREPPSSAQIGDSALITQGGAYHGWLGGSCTQPTVLREAQRALRDGVPRLIALSSDPELEARPGVTALPMTCHSGGSVDIYIEPLLPVPRLLVFGVSPIAQAVARIGKVLGYAVEAIDPEADVAAFPEADHVVTEPASSDLAQRTQRDPSRLYAVIATLGRRDETALHEALGFGAAYVGLVASSTRFREVRDLLRARGVTADEIERIRCPAGLDIGAVAPEEIALSVMAEIVRTARAGSPAGVMADALAASVATAGDEAGATAEELDPVCGMSVNPAEASHHADFAGRTYYFCCGGCRDRFIAAPEQFVVASELSDEGGV
ncbi:MAG: XdhC family protein [Gemmatimonadales bacterium]